MNILIVVPWDQTKGGVASVVGNLAKYLQARGHGVFFFHAERNALLLSEGKTKLGFPDFRLRLGLPFTGRHPLLSALAAVALFPLTLFELMRLIRRQRIDIVNVHYPIPAFVFFALCRLVTSIKLVTSVHGADIFPKGRPRDAYPTPLRFLLNSSDAIVANSDAFRTDFLRIFPDLRDKTVFIHNGVHLEELDFGDRQSANGREPYVLCVAAHNEKKGLDVLLRAFARVGSAERQLKLVLVGDGPLRKQLEDLAGTLQLNGQVNFVGSRERREVAEFLHGCELFVLPSRSEPFGIAIIEAMACGKPVVATRTGGIPEIIEHGQDGLLVNPDDSAELADGMERLLNDPKLQRALGGKARAKVKERFRWENTGSAYQQLFQDLGHS
jgi:glycosyltransferase involved in cell wall biosynthesis